jgi:hypothetical protein
MANIYTYQVLRDTTEKAIIKLTANFDGSGQENNTARIQANTLYGALDANNVPLHSALSVSNTALPYYGLSISRIGYNIASQQKGYIELSWTAANTAQSVPIMNMDLCGEYSEDQGMISIPNNAPGATGDIGVQTFGLPANSAYTLFIEIRKDNAYYQRGQFNDPAAFNYGAYNLKP